MIDDVTYFKSARKESLYQMTKSEINFKLGVRICNFYLIELRIPLQLPTWKLQVGRVVMQPADRPQMESFVISFD